MRSIGIIAEYNPFHWGHAYQLEQARELVGPEGTILVLMSGNGVQRGEYAILDKWTRASLAVSYGADIVLEAPLTQTLQGADYFAEQSIDLLSRLRLDGILFGSDGASLNELNQMRDWQDEKVEEIDVKLQSFLKEGYSYAASMEMAMGELSGAPSGLKRDAPNNLLALQYIYHNRQLKEPMELFVIPRIASYRGRKILSGSQIRNQWRSGTMSEEAVPSETYRALKDQTLPPVEAFYPYLRYRLFTSSSKDLQGIFGVREGIEQRILEEAGAHKTFESLSQSLISKRWTRSSIQRILLAILLNITQAEWEARIRESKAFAKLRILAYNAEGRKFLRAYRNSHTMDLFSNMKASHFPAYQLNYRLDRLLSLNPAWKIAEQNQGRYPIELSDDKKSFGHI